MSKLIFRTNFDVRLIDVMGNDHRIVQAAKVSTMGAESTNADDSAELIRYLMERRHGSPFEHCIMQWLVTAPIFVWREFHRHRIASYNEESSRYKQLDPVFYIPDITVRPTVQVGRPGHYTLKVAETPEEIEAAEIHIEQMQSNAEKDYCSYSDSLESGVAREVSRQGLPNNIYSSCYVTMNVRALLNFLSLRSAPSALWEIRQVAEEMEMQFAEKFSQTYLTFVKNGRVAP